MADKWLVYITHGVYVDTDTPLEPEENENDYVELRSRAVAKMWDAGYFSVSREAEIDYEDVTEEFRIVKEIN